MTSPPYLLSRCISVESNLVTRSTGIVYKKLPYTREFCPDIAVKSTPISVKRNKMVFKQPTNLQERCLVIVAKIG